MAKGGTGIQLGATAGHLIPCLSPSGQQGVVPGGPSAGPRLLPGHALALCLRHCWNLPHGPLQQDACPAIPWRPPLLPALIRLSQPIAASHVESYRLCSAAEVMSMLFGKPPSGPREPTVPEKSWGNKKTELEPWSGWGWDAGRVR